MKSPERRLVDLGIVLPPAAAPVANYAPYALSGGLLIISGQLPLGPDGALSPQHKGKLGGEIQAAAGREAARLCALNILAQARAALGSLDRVNRCLRLGGFINCRPHFPELAPVMNGASDLIVEVFGDRGRHARSTIGVAELPLDAACEVEMVVKLK